MAKKISALTELGGKPAADDLLVVVDVSDTTEAATGTTKRVLASSVLGITTRTDTSSTPTFTAADLGKRVRCLPSGAATLTSSGTIPEGFWMVLECASQSVTPSGYFYPSGFSLVAGESAFVFELDGYFYARKLLPELVNTLTFTNPQSDGGNPTLKVAPDTAQAFESLANGATRTYDYDPGADGYYTLAYEFRLVTGGGSYRKVRVTQDFKRVAGVCSLEGAASTSATGVSTGLTVAYSIVSDDVRISVTNATGSAVSGHYWRSTLAGDLPV